MSAAFSLEKVVPGLGLCVVLLCVALSLSECLSIHAKDYCAPSIVNHPDDKDIVESR